MRNGRFVAGLCLIVAAACGAKTLPTAPDELTEGIVVYEDRGFKGRSAHITSDITDLESFDGPCQKTSSNGTTTTTTSSWDNCISSVKVARGWQATLYGDSDYKGSSLAVTSDVADLRGVSGRCGTGMNDCISSIRVGR